MQNNRPSTTWLCLIELHVCPPDSDRALQLLQSVVGLTESAPGCIACTVAQNLSDPEYLHYTERWQSEAGFHRHARSEAFRRVLMALDMAIEEPQVLVGNLSGHNGLAYLLDLCRKEEGGDA